MSLDLNYFYSTEAEQYSFYRIPKTLFTDQRFKDAEKPAPPKAAPKAPRRSKTAPPKAPVQKPSQPPEEELPSAAVAQQELVPEPTEKTSGTTKVITTTKDSILAKPKREKEE